MMFTFVHAKKMFKNTSMQNPPWNPSGVLERFSQDLPFALWVFHSHNYVLEVMEMQLLSKESFEGAAP